MNINYRNIPVHINFRQKLVNIWPYLVFIVATALLLEWQIRYHATFLFSDTLLHFQRIYDIKMQFKTGNFSYFQTNYAFYHSGRIFNALYGPAFAYLNGLILLYCTSWFKYQFIVEFMCLFIASVSMYLLARKAHINQIFSTLLGLIYPEFGIVIGIIKFNWMAWGAAFAPFVIIQGINMVHDKKMPIHWINLALVMAILAQIHVLSTLLMALSLIPFAMYAIITNKHHFQVILDIFKAILVCIGLTANVWGGFLIAYHGNNISSPMKYHLYQHAMHLFSDTNVHGQVPVLLSILFIAQLIYVVITHNDTLNMIATFTGTFFMAISFYMLPFKALEEHYPNLGRIIQFPYRFDLAGYILLLLGAGITLTNLTKGNLKADNFSLICLMLVLMQLFGSNVALSRSRIRRFCNPKQVVLIGSAYHIKDRAKINEIMNKTTSGKLFKYVSHTEPDYLPYKPTNPKIPCAYNSSYGKYIIDKQKYYKYNVKKSKLYLIWHGQRSRKIILPVVMYKQSKLMHNDKSAEIDHFTHNYQPVIKQKKGYNQAVLSFTQPKWFTWTLWLTAVAWLGVFIFYGLWYMRYRSLFELRDD